MLLKAEKIHKVYGNGKKGLEVLKGVDIAVEKGEVAVIIGPSGAGKSTLLHILGALDTPTKGKVLFDGIDLYSLGDSRRSLIRNKRIGFVFQFYHLLAEFSALENVILPAMVCGINGAGAESLAQKAEALLDTVGLKSRIHHRPAQLSGGEIQRVAIARALINRPDIVLCDEPTGNLDSENARNFLELILELNKKNGQTFLIVTHNEELAAVAKKVIHIRDGRLI
jgi:lipoprotein-releasing system ATP-binding protein